MAGTTIDYMFPRLGGLFAGPSASSPAKPSEGQKAILVVDDSATMRTIVCKSLRKLGYQMFEADTGVTGLGEWDCHKEEIILIVSDIFMPGMDGLTFARHVRKRAPKLPIVLISSRIDDDSAWVAEEAGFRCLAKPFTDDQLLGLVNDALGTSTSAGLPATA